MSKSIREALVAIQAFAADIARRYAGNVKNLSSRGSGKLEAFPAVALTRAQTFADAGGDGFVVLGHLEGTNIEFSEMEALIWLANDAVAFDKLAEMKGGDVRDKAVALAIFHGERATARALYLKALLGGYIRVLDGGLLARVVGGEKAARDAVAPLAQKSADEFVGAIENLLPRVKNQAEISAFAQAMIFPTLPVAIGHKMAAHEVINGVVLPSDMAGQWRANLPGNRS
jgi:hypothetical protein